MSNIDIYDNYIYNCNHGIGVASEDGPMVANIRIFNNVIRNVDKIGIHIMKIKAEGPRENILIMNNTIDGANHAILVDTEKVENCIIKNNLIYNSRFEPIRLEFPAKVSSSYNLTDKNPLWMDPANGDYRIKAGSPAINAGDPNSRFNDPDGSRNDLGAYYLGQKLGQFRGDIGNYGLGNVPESRPPVFPEEPLRATVTDNTVKLDWDDCKKAGFTNYRVIRDVLFEHYITKSEYTDSGLEDGTYNYMVVAFNNNTRKVLTVYKKTVVVGNGFVPDTGVLSATVSNDDVSLNWANYNDGNGFASFTVKRDGVTIKSGLTTSAYTDPNLADGTYDYLVQAVAGNGTVLRTYSNTATVTTGPDTGPLTINVSVDDVSLDWANYNDGNGFASYRVKRGGSTIKSGLTTSAYTDPNLANGTYTYLVEALSSNGTVLRTYTNSATVDVEAPPGVISFSVESTTVTLDWADYTGGNGFTNYRLYFNGAIKEWWVPGSIYTDENVAPGTHDYEVHAWDNNGKKVLATYTGTVTVAEPFEPDTGTLNVSVSSDDVSLSWAAYNLGNDLKTTPSNAMEAPYSPDSPPLVLPTPTSPTAPTNT